MLSRNGRSPKLNVEQKEIKFSVTLTATVTVCACACASTYWHGRRGGRVADRRRLQPPLIPCTPAAHTHTRTRCQNAHLSLNSFPHPPVLPPSEPSTHLFAPHSLASHCAPPSLTLARPAQPRPFLHPLSPLFLTPHLHAPPFCTSLVPLLFTPHLHVAPHVGADTGPVLAAAGVPLGDAVGQAPRHETRLRLAHGLERVAAAKARQQQRRRRRQRQARSRETLARRRLVWPPQQWRRQQRVCGRRKPETRGAGNQQQPVQRLPQPLPPPRSHALRRLLRRRRRHRVRNRTKRAVRAVCCCCCGGGGVQEEAAVFTAGKGRMPRRGVGGHGIRDSRKHASAGIRCLQPAQRANRRARPHGGSIALASRGPNRWVGCGCGRGGGSHSARATAAAAATAAAGAAAGAGAAAPAWPLDQQGLAEDELIRRELPACRGGMQRHQQPQRGADGAAQKVQQQAHQTLQRAVRDAGWRGLRQHVRAFAAASCAADAAATAAVVVLIRRARFVCSGVCGGVMCFAEGSQEERQKHMVRHRAVDVVRRQPA
eukprot:315316-Chlamydomonas_euryale.AAC.4